MSKGYERAAAIAAVLEGNDNNGMTILDIAKDVENLIGPPLGSRLADKALSHFGIEHPPFCSETLIAELTMLEQDGSISSELGWDANGYQNRIYRFNGDSEDKTI